MRTMAGCTRAALTAGHILLATANAWSLDLTSPKAADGAGRSNAAVGELRGEWVRAGAGFACRVATQQHLSPEAIEPGVLARSCLHMGPLVIGGEASTLTSVAAAPHRTLPQPDSATALVYFLDDPDRYPYLVVTLRQDRIIALQVSGPAASKGFSFNHVDLGASSDTLIQYFGSPSHLEPSGEADTDLWSYGPWPFSFELRDGHVTSIRIFDPAAFATAGQDAAGNGQSP